MSFEKNIKIIKLLSIYSIIFLNIINNSEAITLSTPQYTTANTVQYVNSSQTQGLSQPSQSSYGTNLIQGYGTVSNTMNNTNLYNSNSSLSTSSGSVSPQYSVSTNLYNNGSSYGNTTSTNTSSQNNNISTTNSRLYSKTKDKSCQIAYAQSNGSYVLDLSDTYDVNNYGSTIIQDFCNKAKQSNYDFVYIDLCNTEVDPQLVAQWNQTLKQNNIQVMWNLSNNSSINDRIISYLGSLDNIKGLNISNTNVSSQGIMKLYELLMNNTDSTIQFINICGINVDQNMKNYLITAFNQHITLWKQKNNGKEYTVFKNAVIDSYNDTNNYLVNGYTGNGLVQYSNNGTNYSINTLQPQITPLGQQAIIQPSYGLQTTIGQTTYGLQSAAPAVGQTTYGLQSAVPDVGQTTYVSQSAAPTVGQTAFTQPSLYYNVPQPQLLGQQTQTS